MLTKDILWTLQNISADPGALLTAVTVQGHPLVPGQEVPHRGSLHSGCSSW